MNEQLIMSVSKELKLPTTKVKVVLELLRMVQPFRLLRATVKR